MFREKLLFTFSILFITFNSLAQVGIANTAPEAALDVTSPDNGILVPRVNLNSLTDTGTVVNPTGNPLVESTLVYNTGAGTLTESGFYYWNGSSWSKLIDDTPDVYFGKAVISSTGNIDITGIPFQPKRVAFTAYANVDSYNLNDDNSTGSNNNNTKENTFGSMRGYARANGSTINQQVIFNGGSGSSINDISRYASSSHCIGLRYTNNDGDNLGLTNASLTSFLSNGFRLNVTTLTDNVVIIYEAYRY